MTCNKIWTVLALLTTISLTSLAYFPRAVPVVAANIYTRQINITNSSGTAQTNYAIEVVYNTAAEITAGRMQPDCDDIRALASDLVTPLSFAVLNCNTTYTSVVIKIPSLPTGGTIAYFTHGDLAFTNIETPLTVFDKYEMFSATTPTCTLSGTAFWDSANQYMRLTPNTAATNIGRCNYTGYLPGILPQRGYKAWFDSWTGTVGTVTGGQAIWQYAFDNALPAFEDTGYGGAHFTIDENNGRFCYRGAGVGCSGTALYAISNALVANGQWRANKVSYSATTKSYYDNGTLRYSTTLGTAPTLTNPNFGLAGRTTATRAREHRVRKFAIIPFNELITSSSPIIFNPSDTISFNLRNETDTASFSNLCNFGDLAIATVATCKYRLKFSTTATNGYTLQVKTSGNVLSGSNIIANAVAGAGGTGGTAITAGSERYGLVLTALDCTGGNAIIDPLFDAGGTNATLINYVVPTTAVSCSGPNQPVATDTTNTVLIDHQIAISGDTTSGDYTQTITWTGVPNY
jgi:hypothetical protein